MRFLAASNSGEEYAIRIPLDMYQLTEASGSAWPVAFRWVDSEGIPAEVKIDRIRSVTPLAEQRAGAVGDRYECEVGGEIVYLYYTKLTPRKWFKIVPCSEKEYKQFYRLRGESFEA